MKSRLQLLMQELEDLRSEDKGCAWTRAQTMNSLAPQTLEEVYELIEAIETTELTGKQYQDNLRQESADMLYHTLFYVHLAKEQNWFDVDDVAQTMMDKHQERMPSIDSRRNLNADEINAYWQQVKAEKRKQQIAEGISILDGIAENLPAATRGQKIQERAAQIGFDWPDWRPILGKVREEAAELETELQNGSCKAKIEDELGDLFFSVINLARHVDIDPEAAIRAANRKFTKRFKIVEQMVQEKDIDMHDMSMDELLDSLWKVAKRQEQKNQNKIQNRQHNEETQ